MGYGMTSTPLIIGDTDPRYETLVRGFNLRWKGSPAYVAVCGSTEAVVAAVGRAIGERKRVTVRGGGHCYENFVTENDKGVIIDLSPMGNVSADERGYCVEGGATLWNTYSRLYKEHGVALPGGSCYSVGAGGHVTAGGYGLLSRLHGLTVDYLDAIEVVYVEGDTARSTVVSRASTTDRDKGLLWAHQGGGGGNFGIVTRFWFRDLPLAPDCADIESFAWKWDDLAKPGGQVLFTNLLKAYGEFLVRHGGVRSPYLGLFTLLHLPQYADASSEIVLTAQEVPGGSAEFGEGIDALRNALKHVISHATTPTGAAGHQHLAPSANRQRMPWLYATQSLNGSGPNRRGKYKSAYMLKSFPDSQIETMWAILSDPMKDQTHSLVQIDSYGGKVNDRAPHETAAVHRSAVMKLQFQTYWTDAAHDQRHLDWIGGLYKALYGAKGPASGDGTMDGCYVGYPDVDLENWPTLYYGSNLTRLQDVKRDWDPKDFFRHAQSIKPTPKFASS
jgi:FAD/FMN-containing dehydrogenase